MLSSAFLFQPSEVLEESYSAQRLYKVQRKYFFGDKLLTYMQGLILSAEVMVAEIEKEGDSYHFQIHHVSRVPNPFVLKPKGNLPLVKK